ncbi:MAG: biopolymer transporter ExbD [Chitinispirillaceae bacterium]|nr:biopolymer transporter ExbD [Chitinispirillaceae bacterium]
MANPRAARQARRRRGNGEVKLNITSMMDMFTIILVFLIKNFSTEGAIVTPAENLTLPKSTVERKAKGALSVQISRGIIIVENVTVLDETAYGKLLKQKEFMITALYDALVNFAEESRKMAEISGTPFSGDITIQGDVEIPYSVLTRVMYTCGQAGYPNMNLFVYRNE